MEREVAWECGLGYRARTDYGQRLRDELGAIAVLIENHPDEFAAHKREVEERRGMARKEGRATPDQRRAGHLASQPRKQSSRDLATVSCTTRRLAISLVMRWR